DLVANRKVVEAGHVGRPGDDALFHNDEAWRADANAGQSIVATLAAKIIDSGYHVGHDSLAAGREVGRARDLANHFAGAIDRRGTQIGATEVNSNGIFSHEGAS